MFGRQKIAMLVAEFLGTATLTSAVYAMAVRTSFPFFAGIAGGLTVGLMVLLIGSISGAHINPAVTLGLWTLRKIDTARALVYIAVQLLGGVAAWRLMEYLLNSPFKDIAGKNNVDAHIMVAEGLGALILGWGVAAAIDRGYDGLQKAAVIGTSFFIGVVVAAFASNALINPAVALGVHSWSISYFGAPIVGAVVGMNIYQYLFAESATRTTARKKR